MAKIKRQQHQVSRGDKKKKVLVQKCMAFVKERDTLASAGTLIFRNIQWTEEQLNILGMCTVWILGSGFTTSTKLAWSLSRKTAIFLVWIPIPASLFVLKPREIPLILDLASLSVLVGQEVFGPYYLAISVIYCVCFTLIHFIQMCIILCKLSLLIGFCFERWHFSINYSCCLILTLLFLLFLLFSFLPPSYFRASFSHIVREALRAYSKLFVQ